MVHSIKKRFSSISPAERNIYFFAAVLFLVLVAFVIFFIIKSGRGLKPEAASVRGQAGDLWADTILGKRDFTEIWGGLVNPQRVSAAGGAIVDRDSSGTSKGRLWLWSGIENRIVGVDLDNCPPVSGDCSAVKVIGQPSLTDYSACNGDSGFQNYPNRSPASASTLCGVNETVLSTAENLSYVGMYTRNGNLYVPDMGNHRVLVYYDPWNTDSVADEVIGQDDFSGIYCNKSSVVNVNPSSSSLCLGQRADDSAANIGNRHGSGVTLDSAGNLWVADSSNHRVLRFPKQTDGKFSKNADIVLGQVDFTSGWLKAGSALNKLKNPNTLIFDPDDNLYVSDNGNSRILKFPPSEQKTGGTGTFFAGSTTWDNVYIGDIDVSNRGFWVTAAQPFNLAFYSFDGTLKKTIFIHQRVVGSIGLGKDGSIVATSPTQGTVYFQSPQTKSYTIWDRNIFISGGINNSRLSQAGGVAISSNQLFVSDTGRILFWNDPASVTSGKPADGYLVQKDFSTMDLNVAYGISVLKADSSNRIWVKTGKGIYVYKTPAVSGAQPIKIFGDTFNVLGGGSITLFGDKEGIDGILPTPSGDYLWVSDNGNNRVIRIKDPLGTNPLVDVILGQASLNATQCNRGQVFTDPNTTPANYLCLPGAMSYDRQGNLFVSDHSLETDGNWRLLMFKASNIPSGNSSVVFEIPADKIFPKISVPIHATWEPAFDSTNRMVVGINGYSSPNWNQSRFLPYYDDPTGPSTTPNGWLKDFYSVPFAATFDQYDNLYVADSTRSRVMIYKNPFANSVSSPVPSPVPTGGNADPTPSPIESPIPSPSPIPTPIPTPSPAPVTDGVLRGVVKNSSGSAIAGASVKIKVDGTKGNNYISQLLTDGSGVFQTTIEGGRYILDANASGYRKSSVRAFVIEGQTVTVNITLDSTGKR